MIWKLILFELEKNISRIDIFRCVNLGFWNAIRCSPLCRSTAFRWRESVISILIFHHRWSRAIARICIATQRLRRHLQSTWNPIASPTLGRRFGHDVKQQMFFAGNPFLFVISIRCQIKRTHCGTYAQFNNARNYRWIPTVLYSQQFLSCFDAQITWSRVGWRTLQQKTMLTCIDRLRFLDHAKHRLINFIRWCWLR